jgi:hypothetical protein
MLNAHQFGKSRLDHLPFPDSASLARLTPFFWRQDAVTALKCPLCPNVVDAAGSCKNARWRGRENAPER